MIKIGLWKKYATVPAVPSNPENLSAQDRPGKLIWGENYNYDSTGTVLEKEEIYDGYVLEVTTFDIDSLGIPQKRGEYFDPSVIFRTMYFHNEFGQLVSEIHRRATRKITGIKILWIWWFRAENKNNSV